MKLVVIPMTLREANDFVGEFHRHSQRTARDGGKFAIGAAIDAGLVGVAIVGRPLARMLQDGFTAEVLRTCTNPATAPKGTCSFLYGRCWRIWQQMGGRRMVTYTLDHESGASLRGCGWKIVGSSPLRSDWTKRKDKSLRNWEPKKGQIKFRWEATTA